MECQDTIKPDELFANYCNMEINYHPNSRQYNIWIYTLELVLVNISSKPWLSDIFEKFQK